MKRGGDMGQIIQTSILLVYSIYIYIYIIEEWFN